MPPVAGVPGTVVFKRCDVNFAVTGGPGSADIALTVTGDSLSDGLDSTSERLRSSRGCVRVLAGELTVGTSVFGGGDFAASDARSTPFACFPYARLSSSIVDCP